jgi:sarcosine oxidase subunit beta
MPDIVVVGGGITGAAAADALAREGHSVTLIEKSGIAAMASGRTLGGVRQSGRDPAELPLARAAVAIWGGLADTPAADLEYRRSGNSGRPHCRGSCVRVSQSQQVHGLDLRFLPDNAAVRAIAPALSADVLAASFCPTDGHANPIGNACLCRLRPSAWRGDSRRSSRRRHSRRARSSHRRRYVGHRRTA